MTATTQRRGHDRPAEALLLAQVGALAIAVPYAAVQGVLNTEPLDPAPSPKLRAIARRKGDVVPVLCTHEFLGEPAPAGRGEAILVTLHGVELGLAVDRILRTTADGALRLAPIPAAATELPPGALAALAWNEEGDALLVDPHRLVSEEDLAEVVAAL